MIPAQTEPKPRGSRFSRFVRRTWKPFLVVIVVLVAIHGIATMILGRRFEADIRALKAQGEPVSTAELGGPKVPDDQNAAVVYAKAFKLIKGKETRESSDTMESLLKSVGAIPSKKKIDVVWSDVDKAAQVYRQVVPLVKEALMRPQCQFPVKWELGPAATFVHLSQLRNLTRILSAMAVLDAHDGNLDEAYKKVGLAFQVAKASKDEPILISTLVTISCTQTANGTLQAVVKYGPPSSSALQELVRLLGETDYRLQWVNAMKGERVSGLWAFNYLLQHGASGYYDLVHSYDGSEDPTTLKVRFLRLLDPMRRPLIYADARHYLKYMDSVIDIAPLRYQQAIELQKRIQATLQKLPKYAIITRQLTPIFTNGISRVDETRAQTALTQILLAAKQYKSRTGQYPESMTQVRSVGLAGIPMDPFSGKDFIYKRTPKGFVAYSIGADLKDDGGRPVTSGSDMVKGGDIVLDWRW
ncbi:MAG: hypothetical protein ACYC1M_09345 [Armatimonadota bacterium]